MTLLDQPGATAFIRDHIGQPVYVNPPQRDYFDRQARWNRRVIFEWRVFNRWPEYHGPTQNLWIEGFAFDTDIEAAVLNIETGRWTSATFTTWEEAVNWVLRDG